MTDRIQITRTCHFSLDGQPQVVLPGTVCDVADASLFRGVCVVLSPGESAGPLLNGKPTTIRNRRTAA
jgi:hypothetical protein